MSSTPPRGPSGEGAEAPKRPFVIHRSGLPQRQDAELPRPLKRMLAAGVAVVILGLVYAARYQLHLVERPRPLPVLPAVVDLIELGMTPEQVSALKERLPAHRGEGHVTGAIGSPEQEEWTFYGYPRGFPPNVVLGDPPSAEGVLRFQDGTVSYLRVVAAGRAPEVATVDVVDGVLSEVERRLKEPQAAPLRLSEVEARLGPGLRAGRLLQAGAKEPVLDLWRWRYAWIEQGKLGELVDLDLLVAPEPTAEGEPDGRVVRMSDR